MLEYRKFIVKYEIYQPALMIEMQNTKDTGKFINRAIEEFEKVLNDGLDTDSPDV